jgi:hypothetical protein
VLTRWAERHRAALTAGLDEGERLLAAHRVVLNAATPSFDVLTRGDVEPEQPSLSLFLGGGLTGGGRRRRLQRKAARGRGSLRIRVWAARDVGFPAPSGIFVVGLSDRRLLVWKATSLLARPRELIDALPLGEIDDVEVVTRLGTKRLAVRLGTGAVVVLQPLWDRRVSGLSRVFAEAKRSSAG